MISYDKLWPLLEAAGQTTYTLRRDKTVTQATIERLRKGEPLSTATIDRLCELLSCQPGDIMEWRKD